MKLRILSKEGYSELQSYAKNNASDFINGVDVKDSMTLDYINHEVFFEKDDINKINNNYKASDDYENAILIFKYLKGLSSFEGSDKRLWGYLTYVIFKKYTLNRWSKLKSNPSFNTIQDRFFYEGAGLYSRARNSIARLYWGTKNTIDEKNRDKYHLTKIYFKVQDITTLFERNIGTYNNLLREYLSFLKTNKSLITSKKIQVLNRKINLQGSVQDLSTLSNNKIRTLLNKICDDSKF